MLTLCSAVLLNWSCLIALCGVGFSARAVTWANRTFHLPPSAFCFLSLFGPFTLSQTSWYNTKSRRSGSLAFFLNAEEMLSALSPFSKVLAGPHTVRPNSQPLSYIPSPILTNSLPSTSCTTVYVASAAKKLLCSFSGIVTLFYINFVHLRFGGVSGR